MRLTGRSAFLLVNTHWHSDHTWGNQEFAEIPIGSTPRTLELMIADAPADLRAWQAEIDVSLADLRSKLESADVAERTMAARRIAGTEHLEDGGPRVPAHPPRPADRGPVGDRGRAPRSETLTYGGGHTDSDIFAWLPEDRIVIAGDLCWNGIHPRTHDGHPGPWADILDRMAALGPQRIHPGHGRPGGPEIPQVLAPLLAGGGRLCRRGAPRRRRQRFPGAVGEQALGRRGADAFRNHGARLPAQSGAGRDRLGFAPWRRR